MITVPVTLLTCIISAIAQYTVEGDEHEFQDVLSTSINWYYLSKASKPCQSSGCTSAAPAMRSRRGSVE